MNERNTKPVVRCIECGREYRRTRADRRYCSGRCRTLACRGRERWGCGHTEPRRTFAPELVCP
jgi:hypothetical protein